MRRIDQQPNDVQDFHVDSYTEELDEDVFTLPPKCTADFMCPLISLCTAARKASSLEFLQ